MARASPGWTIRRRTVTSPPADARQRAQGHTITLRDLSAYYGDNHAIKGVNLDYAANRVTAMIGPSGCGKSTLCVASTACTRRSPARTRPARSASTTSTSTATASTSSACAATSAWSSRSPTRSRRCRSSTTSPPGLRLTGTKGVNVRERVEQSLRGAGLWDEVKDRLGQPGIGLSGGQQQRLCIARTIAVEPEVILMDEPCSALDPIATLKIEELIFELKKRYTIMIVTHNMQQAARVADTTAFLLTGEMVEHAPTEKIFSNPEDERTEEYVTGKFG